MDSEEEIKRASISFDGDFNKKQVEKFFKYLFKNSINVEYQVKIIGKTFKEGDGKIVLKKKCIGISGIMTDVSSDKDISSRFSCTINGFVQRLNFSDYALEGTSEEKTKLWDKVSFVQGLNFKDYIIEGASKEQIQLWDKVRKLTENYIFGIKK